ncbi:MAG TPA: hypothetical protein VEX43_16510 [Chthoniobacterales bacterium]|nr:hypothetical protein [Chthoniobacterales bacterium]
MSVPAWEAPAEVKRPAPKQVRRQIFVLTPEEKRTVCFVLLAFVLGLATKHYRATHAVTPLQAAIDHTITTAAHPPPTRTESKRGRQFP